MRVLFLAAGFATRLYPLTRDRAKPLLEVQARPVLTWILEVVLQLPDIAEIMVVSNAKFASQFEAWARDDAAPRAPGIPIHVINDGATDDANKLGGIGDMALGMAAFDDAGDDDVLVLAGDNLLDFSLLPHSSWFQRLSAPMMIARKIDGPVPPERYGEVQVDSTGRIVAMREKPKDPQSQWTATCIYFLTPAARRALIEYLSSAEERDAPGHFMAWLAEQMPVYAEPFVGRLHDIGNHESLAAAEVEFVPLSTD